MLALITSILADIPILSGLVKTIASWFTVTSAQKQQDIVTQIQTEEKQINTTGRPE